MLSCSQASSLDWGASGSLPQLRRQTARSFGELKSVPGHQCLRDRTHFRCPWKKGPITQVKLEEATSCYSHVLRLIIELFGTEASRDAWSERALGRLLHSLSGELNVLAGTTEQDQSCPLPFALAIRTYFLGIFHSLKVKTHSPCAWEIIRVEMRGALSAFPLSGRRSPRKRRSSLQRSLLSGPQAAFSTQSPTHRFGCSTG